MEPVEVRRLLSTIVVDTLADETAANSTTSLREAIQHATYGDAVTFKAGLVGQITLTNGELFIDKNLTISGPGSASIRVSGNNASRVFDVDAGVHVSVSGLTITGGRAETGGGILNAGLLSLSRVAVTGNVAHGADGEFSDGGDGAGGAIYNSGVLTVVDSSLNNNTAAGGDGQLGMTEGNAGNASGGAIHNTVAGAVTLTRVTLNNNTARGGSAVGGPGGSGGGNGGEALGGALFSANDCELLSCTLSNNAARGSDGGSGDIGAGTGGRASGGAVYSTGALDLARTTLSSNFASAGNGGAVFALGLWATGGDAAGGAIFQSGYLSVGSSVVVGNYANGGNEMGAIGGAICVTGGLQMAATTVSGNTAKADPLTGDNPGAAGASAAGGGVWVGGGGTIANCTFADNRGVGSAGGAGFDIHGSDTPSAPGGAAQGGAIFAAGGVLGIINSTLSGNSLVGGAGGDFDPTTRSPGAAGGAAQGGGVFAAGPAFVQLKSVTIAANTATGGRGGAASPPQPGEPQVPAGATGAAAGGGVYRQSAGGVTVANTIIATNAAATAPDISATVTSSGFNLVGKTNGSSGWVSSDKKGTTASPLNPKLGALGNYGGPTKIMPLLAGSPAIDAGKALGLTTDQRGKPRPNDFAAVPNAAGGDGSDIGAVELTVLPGGPQPTPFSGTPVAINATGTATIQAENFDNGGEGVAYHDVNSANLGGAYRATGVDLQATTDTGGGYNVGWTRGGEWLAYTVNVAAAGSYTFDFRVASNGAGGKFHVEVDGKNVTGSIAVAGTGGWQTWKTITKAGVALPAGKHVLKLVMESVGASGAIANFNYLKVARAATAVTLVQPFTVRPLAIGAASSDDACDSVLSDVLR